MEKKRKKKKLKLRHIIICFLFGYLGLIFWNQRTLMKRLETKKQAIETEVKTLEMEIEGLNKEIEDSDSLQFVEKVARDELGMVKPREIIYIDKNKKKNPFLGTLKKHN
ncbi:FtsB family cell division protein [Tissierella praeacuta]|uniref:Cell division protein FtsB n=1 Tax=Tissierella praeacuta DSM 18095 TaxID=1123404 RepID=A0A1M4UNR2_9FIRM|nr:septum formation initiator family protein [Tissierella praeacuta]HAE92492.1 septum formation initiator family protein [Tissierella sp.]MBU5257279.1 septum formation initiator family protein [Tissierella praeacuta]TCU68892.1 cell division protein FtsB [Tissierella praeacuta]SHE58356.1 Cell division protein FtsB [Tissierella praeacuta DSM 18095]SUP03494.1 Septum formation initiator [Tissierella praeacuta]